jgi:hypothetical protein
MKRFRFVHPAKEGLPPFKVIHLDRLKILMGAKETWFVEDDLIPCWAPTRVVKRNPEGVREALEKRRYNLPRALGEKLAQAAD